MSETALPHSTQEVLAIPTQHVPAIVADLVRRRELSGLISEIHKDFWSGNGELRRQSRAALAHLGFPE